MAGMPADCELEVQEDDDGYHDDDNDATEVGSAQLEEPVGTAEEMIELMGLHQVCTASVSIKLSEQSCQCNGAVSSACQ